jgi:valyl-tRNA synthetase
LLGKNVLLLPGKDHAGIQTQVVFERKLRAEGVELEKLSRAEFYNKCYEFCIDRSNYMRVQEKSLGISADWEREIFTLDPRLNSVVYDTFIRMYNDGLVYRGKRMVHWSVYSQTAISDVEVEYKEENGHLWDINYVFVNRKAHPARVQKFWNDYQNTATFEQGENNAFVAIAKAELDWKINELLLVGEGEEQKAYLVYKIEKIDLKKADKLADYQDFAKSIAEKKLHEGWEQVCIYHLVNDLPLENHLTVSTTRPETLLGDSAIAVHSQDPRYTHLIGEKVIIPLINKEIPIIADDRIDPTYGTGAVKVTPAHDFNDYQIGLTHNLEQIQINSI